LSCNSKKGVYWCGDHPCINKKERESYFKKTMIVEIREIDIKEFKKDSDSEKLMKQAKINEKTRIKDQKELKKQAKLNEKKRIKIEKELKKQSKIDEKKRIENEKELDKQEKFNKVNDGNVKPEKKISESVTQSEELIKELNEEEKEFKLSKTSNSVSSNEFDVIVEQINKRNNHKSFPDINDTP